MQKIETVQREHWKKGDRIVFFFRNILYAGFCILFLFAAVTFEEHIPDQIYVREGEDVSWNFDVPVTVTWKEQTMETAETNGKTKDWKSPGEIVCKLFGIIPVKTVQVVFVEGDAVYVNGAPIGIYVRTNGVLVIGAGEIETADGERIRPAENILSPGDYIMNIDGIPVEKKEDLQEIVQKSEGKREIIGVKRGGEYIEVALQPVPGKGGQYLLGVWVRDDLAGIGTLTYYDASGKFGALGHSVSDSDVGKQIDMKEGWIYTADIIGIKRGEKGEPGELAGVISYQNQNCLGTIGKNTEIGIYGTLDGNLAKLETGQYYPVCYKQEIKKEKAYILSGMDGETKQYEIEIEDLDYSGREKNKGILFQVTDENLLALTGGVVQGMSGSPILQNGKIIGAVTHVFVNDPTRGYGIFIESMLEEGSSAAF